MYRIGNFYRAYFFALYIYYNKYYNKELAKQNRSVGKKTRRVTAVKLSQEVMPVVNTKTEEFDYPK